MKDNVLTQDDAGTIQLDRVRVVKVIHSVNPKFPKRPRQEGLCVISLTVDTDGKPQTLEVKKSLNPAYDESALKAISQYRFKPAALDGKPVAMQINVEVNFQVR